MKSSEKYCQHIEPSYEYITAMIGISYRFISDHITRLAKEEGFPAFSMQYMAIIKNIEKTGTTVNGLAEKISISKQAVSKMAKDLEKSGYITTKKNPNDSRSVLMFPTPQADDLIKFIKKHNQKFVKEFSTVLNEKRAQAFITDLHLLMRLIIDRATVK